MAKIVQFVLPVDHSLCTFYLDLESLKVKKPHLTEYIESLPNNYAMHVNTRPPQVKKRVIDNVADHVLFFMLAPREIIREADDPVYTFRCGNVDKQLAILVESEIVFQTEEDGTVSLIASIPDEEITGPQLPRLKEHLVCENVTSISKVIFMIMDNELEGTVKPLYGVVNGHIYEIDEEGKPQDTDLPKKKRGIDEEEESSDEEEDEEYDPRKRHRETEEEEESEEDE
jgi:hypothetical protein